MNGILILSLDSGMLIFSECIAKNFGLEDGSIGSDPMQLSGVIFTLYKTACEIEIPSSNNTVSALSHFNMVSCFHTCIIIESDRRCKTYS